MPTEFKASIDIDYIEIDGLTVIVPTLKEIERQVKFLERGLPVKATKRERDEVRSGVDLYKNRVLANRERYGEKIQSKKYKFRQYSQMDRLEAQMSARVEWNEDEQPRVDPELYNRHIISACTGESVDSLKQENHVIYDALQSEVLRRNNVTIDQIDFFDISDTKSGSDS